MKKVLGIFSVLVTVALVTAIISPAFLSSYNIENLLRRSALFGIIGIGASLVIITGGIDLSIGSVICLIGCLTPWLITVIGISPWIVVPSLLVLATGLGLTHGFLVTRLKLQPFLVTLCGLFVYRGITRGILADSTVGFGTSGSELRSLGTGRIPITDSFGLPAPLLILAVVALVTSFGLRRTIWGRHLLAIGSNETAARHCGIDVNRVKIGAYALCGLLAGLGGLLFVLDTGSAQPSNFGNFYELYAIAAAVLGGCSLRGGEGTVIGVLIGATLVQVLRNAIVLIDEIPDSIEFAVIGGIILLAVIADEAVRRAVARRSNED
ncbi:MAG: ABC transporter permease [Planctomycetota bacterium]|nr:ABC transporter permease [Planctomycetota bacterium]